MPTWLSPFFSPIISAGVAFAILYINHLRDKNKSEAGDEKNWRQARLDAEKRLSERVEAEARERALAQLKFEQDLAAVTGILKEFAEAQRLLTGLATETRGLSGRVDRVDTRLDQYNESLEAIREHIMQLAINQTKQP